MKKRILYLGGSITCGARASDYERSWARLSFNGFARALYGDDVEMLNASISGTGSRVAAFRLHDHVLSYHPDMVLVEFAVNDNEVSKQDREMVIASMEYLVRTLKAHNPDVAITFVYTTNRDGENASHAHTVVAQHYGIPEIDLRAAVLDKIHTGENTWDDFLADAAHPADAGHRLYADVVTRTILSDPARFTAPVREREPIASCAFRAPRMLTPTVDEADGFTIGDANDRSPFKRLPTLLVQKAAIAERVGATLSYSFEGNHFGVYARIGGNGGRVRVEIDGVDHGTIEGYHRYGEGTEIGGEYISRFYVRTLTDGAHRATLTTLPPHPDSVGSTVSIAAFLVD